MPGTTVRVTLNWVLRLMAMPKSHSSSLRSWKAVKSSSCPKTTMPALLTSTSMRPWHSTASATMAWTWSILVRSAVCELTVAPSSRSSSARSCTASAMSQMASSAPSSREDPGRREADAVLLRDARDEGDLALDPALACHAVSLPWRGLHAAAAAGDGRRAMLCRPQERAKGRRGPGALECSRQPHARVILPNLPQRATVWEFWSSLSNDCR